MLYETCEHSYNQGLRASSLQFTSPLEFNAIFCDGFTLRHELTAGSEISRPCTGKVQTRHEYCNLYVYYVVITSRTCRHWNFQKADFEP